MPLPPSQPHDPNLSEALLQRNTSTGEPLRWPTGSGGRVVITWNFMTAGTADIDSEVQDFTDFSPLTAGQRSGVERALAYYDDLLNVDFRFAPGAGAGADLRFANAVPVDAGGNPLETLIGVTLYHYLPDNGRMLDARIVYNSNLATNFDQRPGSDGYHTTLHELGHALGLDHSGASAGETLPPALRPAFDSHKFTIMSYATHPGLPAGVFPETPMLYDIAALEALYGSNPGFHAGNDVYRLPAGRVSVQTLVDRGGLDVIDAGNHARGVLIDLRPGAFSTIGPAGQDNVAIAFGTTIEQARGSPAGDLLVGNGVANLLRGRAGADELFGLGGADLLRGDAGADRLAGGGGRDTLVGGGGADVLVGGRGPDLLRGGAGADVFRLTDADDFGDRIDGFARAADRIHLVDLLDGFDPMVDALGSFVQASPQGPHTRLMVDPDGGGNGFLDAALLLGFTAAAARAALIEPDVVELAL